MFARSALNTLTAPGLAAGWGVVLRVAGRRMGWAALLLVLVLAPVLGQMHRIHHQVWRAMPGAGTAALAAWAVDAGQAPALAKATSAGPVASTPGQWLDRLFSQHVSDAECLVFDQLGQDGPPQALAVADLGSALSHFMPWWLDATLVAATAAPCQARAPPLSR